MNNIIEMHFGNKRNAVSSDYIYQYDRGIKLKITGLEHFDNIVQIDISILGKMAIPSNFQIINDEIYVDIPSPITNHSGWIYVYIVNYSSNFQRTVYVGRLECKRREKADEYEDHEDDLISFYKQINAKVSEFKDLLDAFQEKLNDISDRAILGPGGDE